MSEKKLLLRAALSALIVVLTVYALVLMLVSTNESKLISKGIENFRYFTLDSNVLMGAAAIADFIFTIAAIKGKRIPAAVDLLFYTGTAAVTLTLLTVMLFLGPLYGYGAMLERSNLYFHLITPLLAVFSLCFLHRGMIIGWRDIFISMLPMLIYGVFYISMILIYGLEYPKTDWYYFAMNGMKSLPVSMLIMLLAGFLISYLLRLACGGKVKKDKK